MGNGELTLVQSLSEFMEWAAQFNQGGYLFRGVTNEEYNISASAYRRLKNGMKVETYNLRNSFKLIGA